jgi:putative restriction endonuclease
MSPAIKKLLSPLQEKHQTALLWFMQKADSIQPWPAAQNGTLLATRAKGIYKPKWSIYALSIRETLSDNYPDKDPKPQADGSWLYDYFQEGDDPKERDKAYTNKGLMACCRDHVPVGVMRQVEVKPTVRYSILGLAVVTEWEDGYFRMRGFSLADMRQD